MSWLSKPKSFLGVDLGAGGVKLVELRQEKNRPVLFTYGLTSAPQDVHRVFAAVDKTIDELTDHKTSSQQVAKAAADPGLNDKKIEEYAALLRLVCKQAKTVSKSATVSLPISLVFHALINLPLLKKEELGPILKAEIKKLLPRPIEEMALDYQILPALPEQKTIRVLVNAVPREVVTFYTQVFKRAGLILDALEPESVALERALVGRDASVVMLVDIGAERTNFFIIDQSVAVTHQSVELGGAKINKILGRTLGIEDSLVEQLKYDLFNEWSNQPPAQSKENLLTLLAPIIDPIIKEIEYSFEMYLRQSGNENKRPEKVILTGGGANLPFLSEYIAEKFKLKCYLGDPWGRIVFQDGLKPLLHKIGPRMSVAIGLALRNVV
ncbi:MAG: Type IV pilus assembly protein PilM [Candidatus Magasanikbacteria bacterium GW2011_GWA2_37_8]|uniref:Type IV pilus assembly protein PilM n=1 Tax=Candidatus Magasanikbacteria bacterium GW2011_GWA2_37_8 TaxID=1619036 RepID=A0A0G0HGI8_9BACT|nr:MAG: Type IV pilus assembly protein PilM [Candidatus Magasanikbacteria bacterium GW2011_GWA2_37_8]